MQDLNMGTSDDYTLSGGLPKGTPDSIEWEKGDTLTSASRETGIPLSLLKEWNGGTDAIQAGGSLKIPDAYYESSEAAIVDTSSVAIAQTEEALIAAAVEPTATYAKLWGKAYHTEAENDVVKQADYVKDVETYVKTGSSYVQKMSPILDTVVAAFAGDEGTDPTKLHRAMLEIGAHESEGGTQLYNKKSGASGVFQVLASTVLATASSTYYGPKAQALAGKTPKQIKAMTKLERESWMQTNPTANAVFGTIELIKLSKGLANNKRPSYLNQLQPD